MSRTAPDRSDFPRFNPTTVLPTHKAGLPRQLEVLRAWARLCNSAQSVGTHNGEIASTVGIAVSTLSMMNPFFANVGFLEKSGNRYWPSLEVHQFNQSYEEGRHDAATHALAPLLVKTWFARALLPRLAHGPIEEVAAVRLLVEAARVGPNRRIVFLLIYLTAAGVIERQNGQIRLAGPAVTTEPQPASPGSVIPRSSTGAIKVNIEVDWDVLRTGDNARLSGFLSAVRLIKRATKSAQVLTGEAATIEFSYQNARHVNAHIEPASESPLLGRNTQDDLFS
jgi:hypothetical protein